MSQKLRQDQILDILKAQGYVTVRYLTNALQYSTATVNRDLNAMQLLGLVKRSYGGVELAKERSFPPLSQRLFYQKMEKRRIAEKAAEQIQNGDTVFLEGTTTVQYMLPFLLPKKELTVITNSLRLALDLGDSPFNVVCLGGKIAERPHVLYSEETVENAMRYRPDKMFFSTDCITVDGSIHSDTHLFHTILLKNSREVWFLTDKTKLTDHLSTVLCDFSHLTGVVSDFEFPAKTKERYPNVRFFSVGDEKNPG